MLERRVQQLEEYVHDLERYIKRLEIKMTNEMLRPMTAGEGTTYEVLLDADKITDFDVMGDMLTIQHKPDKSEKEILQEFVFKLAQALNPPIWVMDAVLEAVKKEPNAHYLILDKLDSPYYERSMDVDDIKRGDYIQADCPLALQVLLGFTTEGELRC
jgi:hypothetical protein